MIWVGLVTLLALIAIAPPRVLPRPIELLCCAVAGTGLVAMVACHVIDHPEHRESCLLCVGLFLAIFGVSCLLSPRTRSPDAD